MFRGQRKEPHHVEQYHSALSGVDIFSLASERSFPRHSHDEFGFGVMQSGGHRSWSGRGMVEAVPGDVICVNPGEVHDGMSMDGGVRAWRMLYVEPWVVHRQAVDEIEGHVEISRPVISDVSLGQRIMSCFNCIAAGRRLDLLASEELLIDCLGLLLGKYGTKVFARSSSSLQAARALEYLHARITEPVSLSDLASLYGVSRFRLLRSFKREMGITPYAYLLQLRVQRAQRSLKKGLSVAEAAVEAGFADQSHLTRCFTRQLGITPGRYKAAIR